MIVVTAAPAGGSGNSPTGPVVTLFNHRVEEALKGRGVQLSPRKRFFLFFWCF